MIASVPTEKGGVTMAKDKILCVYEVEWTAKYGNAGKETFFTEKSLNAWLKRMKLALLTCNIKKIII